MKTMRRPTSSAKFKDRICNLIPSEGTERDWLFENALEAGALEAPAALPAAVDLRQSWWTIGDQLTTGSCVGWASADGVMRYLLVKASKLPTSQKLSPRFVWMASKETDVFTARPESFIEGAGTSLKAAADIIRKYGTVPETTLPFSINPLMYTGSESSFYAAAATRKCASYYNLQKSTLQWKKWLATNGPILAALSVDASWDSAPSDGKIGPFQPGTVRGGHAISIVGYTTDRFIVRNSWGTGWGHKGFGYITPEYIAAAFFSESYGMLL